jgi:glycosyltransferase involved in cell wall biosynthesis
LSNIVIPQPWRVQRRPEQGLDYRFVRRLLGTAVKSIHIHNAPDYLAPSDCEPGPDCTVSYYSETADSYRDALSSCNVFVCPRFTEGIGLSMLDALARGMCVIAHDAPSANEYIINGVNGLLVDYRNPRPIVLSAKRAEEIGRAAREMYVAGSRKWQKSARQVSFFIESTPEPDLRSSERRYRDDYLSCCRFAQQNSARFFARAFRLYNKGFRLSEESAATAMDHVKWTFMGVPGFWHSAIVARGALRRIFRQVGSVGALRGKRTAE